MFPERYHRKVMFTARLVALKISVKSVYGTDTDMLPSRLTSHCNALRADTEPCQTTDDTEHAPNTSSHWTICSGCLTASWIGWCAICAIRSRTRGNVSRCGTAPSHTILPSTLSRSTRRRHIHSFATRLHQQALASCGTNLTRGIGNTKTNRWCNPHCNSPLSTRAAHLEYGNGSAHKGEE